MRLAVLAALLLVALAGFFVALTWRPEVRIARVAVLGGDAGLAALAEATLAGTYLGIVPRDSTFFFPAHEMRAAILAARSDLAAVSIRHAGLTALVVTLVSRVPVARWCGSTYSPQATLRDCYLFDANGFLYAPASATSSPLDSFRVYDALSEGAFGALHATLADPRALPMALAFARSIADFGGSATDVALEENGEASVFLAGPADSGASGTRLIYVLGQEQAAYAALAAAKANLDLADGSLEYVDLRFPGKVYFKKK